MNEIYSIITVCLNSVNDIEKTIVSVLNQDYVKFEYIIIDGGSTDGTLDIIKKWSKKDERIKYLSEEDKGIYDAMNKGLKIATGDIIYFLNAGDILYKKDVLGKLITYFKDYDIVYGNVITKKNEIVYKNKLNLFFFIMERMICHQAIFSKKSVFHDTGLFDIKYKFCADKDWLIKAYKLNKKIKWVNCFVVEYDMNGISSQIKNYEKMKIENEQIMSQNFGILIYNIFKLKRTISKIKSLLCKTNKKI